MGFESRKMKSWKSSSGVSDVIGNILILMITVVLFSSIIVFVNQIPVPEQVKKVNFTASASFWDGGSKANLTITHAGGQILDTTFTTILVNVDGITYSFDLGTDPGLGGAEHWTTGMSWETILTNTTYSSSIDVTVVDMEKHRGIWGSQVTGGGSGSPPNILQRYTDADQSTPTADPVKEFDNFTLFVMITDPDNDLNLSNVWIDSSQFEDGVSPHEDGSHRIYDNPTPPTQSITGWFQWDFNVWHMNTTTQGYLMYPRSVLDGAVIWIHASDKAGHVAVSSFILSVIQLPTNTNTITELKEINQETGESGLPSYIKWISGNQGFGFYGENITDGVATGKADVNDERYTFYKDEMVFIRVASLDMSNIFGENRMEVIDTRTGLTYSPPGGTSDVFYPYPSGGSAHVYESKFNTSLLPPSAYTFAIYLKSLPVPGEAEAVFQTKQVITIEQEGSSISFIPKITLYSTAVYTPANLWGYSKATAFTVSGTTYTIYALVSVLDTQVSPAPTVEEIRIVDMQGGSQLYGVPPAGTVITGMTRNNDTTYKFSIDLRFNNGDQWLSGTNSYALYISKFSDANEGVYSLSTQLFVKATLARSDFFAGTTGVYSSLGGSQNFVVPDYLYYVQNNNFFTTRVMYAYPNAPSTTPDYTSSALGVGDIDGDGDKDVLMAQKAGGALLYFENTLNTYGVWQSAAAIIRPTVDISPSIAIIEWIAIGDINGDGDNDFAYSSSGNRVVIYNNTYGMTPWVYKTFTTDIRKIDLRDMTGDGRADLVVLAGGKIYIYDIKLWTPGGSADLIAKFPNTDTAYSGGSGIVDFDIEDMNQDGMLDVLTVGDVGIIAGMPDVRGVWVNNYTTNAAPTLKKLDSTAPGYSPGPKVANGTVVTGSVTTTQDQDGIGLRVRENTSAEPDSGRVNFTMKFQTLTSSLDQLLVVRARINSGSAEVFYAWFSTDTDGVTGKYIPMFAIANSSYMDYTFRLPSTVINKAIYLRFTDSLTTLGSTNDFIDIDYVVVKSGIYGGYTTSRYQVVGSALGYICVRGANIDGTGDGHLETIVAKNGYWRAYEFKTPISGWKNDTGATDFYVECSSMTDSSFFSSIAPTLFDAVDINGDGYTDVITANYTTGAGSAKYVHKFGVFVNLNPAKWYYLIKDLYAPLTDPRGSITVLTAANVFQS